MPHTPGSWKVGPVEDEVKIFSEQTLGTVCAITSGMVQDGELWREEMLANARLIAAAPELLHIAKQMRDRIKNVIGHSVEETVVADAIIAKAEGF